MAVIGGSIEQISLNGRIFAVPADVEAQRKLGGFENEVQANGDGNARLLKTRVPLSVEGLTVVIDDDRGDQEFLKEVADANDFVVFTMTLASGITWQGSVQIVGDFQASTQNATCSISLMGPNTLTKQ